MKVKAYILLSIFVSLIAVIVISPYIDDAPDISFALNMNEEERSSECKVNVIADLKIVSELTSMKDYINSLKSLIEYVPSHYTSVFLEVTSPPPRF